MNESTELSPLAPGPIEVTVAVLAIINLALLLIVLVQLLRGRLTVPHPVLALGLSLFLPVVGPLLVLAWPGRGARLDAQEA